MTKNRTNQIVTVRNAQGLHARPCDLLVRTASQFEAAITIIKDGENFDPRSILSLMTLAAEQGTQLLLQAEGPDAELAVSALAELFARGFDEMGINEPAKDPSTDG